VTAGQLARSCTASRSHHDARGAGPPKQELLYHANQLDAIAATRRTEIQ